MATKREIMAVGTAAPLARMLGSDSPHVVVPGGIDRHTATRLETNFVLLTGGLGGVRLPPASAQYLHCLFNSSVYTVEVYPHDDERINNQLPGEPFLLEAWMSGVFAPARRAWIGGALPGSAAVVPSSIPGPFGIGTDPPADAQAGLLFVNNTMVLEGRPYAAGGDTVGHLLYNAYAVANPPAATGVFRYLADGPAYDISFDSNEGGSFGPRMAIRYAPPGTAGSEVHWQRINTFQAGVLMMDPVPVRGTGSDLTAHLMFNGVFDAALNEFIYFAPGPMPAADIVFDATSQLFAFRGAPPGIGGAVIPWSARARFFLAPQGDGQSNLQLMTQNGGVQTVQPVLTGPPGSGPGGVGRALYVAT